MKKMVEMPVSCLQYDKLPMNPSTLRLIDDIRAGCGIPPIKVQKIRDGYKVKDGRHRLLAHKLLGIERIKCWISV